MANVLLMNLSHFFVLKYFWKIMIKINVIRTGTNEYNDRLIREERSTDKWQQGGTHDQK